MVTWKNSKYKRGMDIEVKKQDTGHGVMYDVFLSNPYLGKKKVRSYGEDFMEINGIENEAALEKGLCINGMEGLLYTFFHEEEDEEWNTIL